MANEIAYNYQLKITKGKFLVSTQATGNADLNGIGHMVHDVVDVPVEDTESIAVPLYMGNVATPGWAWFKNLDENNFVLIGIAINDSWPTFIPFIKLKAGESAILRLATTEVFAVADTATVTLEYGVCED